MVGGFKQIFCVRFFSSNYQTFQKMSNTIKLTNYDIIGFDLDNTLLEYNLTNLLSLQYSFLRNYLVEKKSYNKNILSKKLTEKDVDFIQRGLFLDIARGNVLHLRSDGYIIKASHGTKEMNNTLLEHYYGKERKWSVTDNISEDLSRIWDNDETRAFLDFTDSVATLLFAKSVDSIDLLRKPEKYQVWSDLLEAIVQMYQNGSSFHDVFFTNIMDYVKPCNEQVLNWLKSLRKFSKLILITGSEFEVAEISLPICLGQNYREYFDLIVYNAKKPGFFNKSRPFLSVDNDPVKDIIMGEQYRQGNWSDLHKKISSTLNKIPKCIYIGDNPVQDIFTPTTISQKLDVIALIEEVAAEGLFPGYEDHQHSKFITSKFWGPFIHTDKSFTLIGNMIKSKAKLVIPSLKVLAEKPVEYEHTCILGNE